VRVRVAESTLVRDLLDFLRRCGCEVEQSSPDVLDVQLQPEVSVEAVLSLVRDRLCYGCGGRIPDVLAKLGSSLCHDCRDRAASGRAPERSLGALWARMEVDAYLRIWRAQHPDTAVSVLDGRLAQRDVVRAAAT
jgi:hypothetical protein